MVPGAWYYSFTRSVEASVFGKVAHRSQEVRLVDRSSECFEGKRAREYEERIFDAVAICYNPCSPRETFELTWTKVCLIYAPFLMPQNNTRSGAEW